MEAYTFIVETIKRLIGNIMVYEIRTVRCALISGMWKRSTIYKIHMMYLPALSDRYDLFI